MIPKEKAMNDVRVLLRSVFGVELMPTKEEKELEFLALKNNASYLIPGSALLHRWGRTLTQDEHILLRNGIELCRIPIHKRDVTFNYCNCECIEIEDMEAIVRFMRHKNALSGSKP